MAYSTRTGRCMQSKDVLLRGHTPKSLKHKKFQVQYEHERPVRGTSVALFQGEATLGDHRSLVAVLRVA